MKQPSRDGGHFVFDILFLFTAETCVYRLVHGCINFIYRRIELFDWTFFAKAGLPPLSLHQKQETKQSF